MRGRTGQPKHQSKTDKDEKASEPKFLERTISSAKNKREIERRKSDEQRTTRRGDVTISAKRLTETRGGGTRTVNIIRHLDLHGSSSFSLQGSQSQCGGTVL